MKLLNQEVIEEPMKDFEHMQDAMLTFSNFISQ
jgi:hypothetical protein